MKKTVFNTEKIEPACEYCQSGKPAPDGESVLCAKKGVVPKSYRCKKYKYAIMKRAPKKAPKLQQLDTEDFSI